MADAHVLRRGLRLEYATLGWNVVGSVVVLAAAVAARSVAPAGFGLDSLIEILASAVVVWQLRGAAAGREQRAMRVIGSAFLALAAYVAAQSAYSLAAAGKPHHSPAGIAWLRGHGRGDARAGGGQGPHRPRARERRAADGGARSPGSS